MGRNTKVLQRMGLIEHVASDDHRETNLTLTTEGRRKKSKHGWAGMAQNNCSRSCAGLIVNNERRLHTVA